MGALIDIKEKKQEKKMRVIDGKQPEKPHMTKSGIKKRTPNNQSPDRWVDPIRSMDDINLVKEYLLSKIEKARKAKRLDWTQAARRNYLYFVMGINIGIRASDMLKLTWANIYYKDTIKHKSTIKEQKTGKTIDLYFSSKIRELIANYVEECQIEIKPKKYVFIDGFERKLTDREMLSANARIDVMMKDIMKNCEGGLQHDHDGTYKQCKYAARSIRKTFAYQRYLILVQKNDPLALAKVQKYLNHRDQLTTLRYLGLSQNENSLLAEDLDL